MSTHLITRFLCVALASTVITTMDVDVAEAKRKTLLEQWFPKAAQRMRAKRNRQFQETEIQKPVQVKKVSGPRYYTYKTETLQTVALAGLLPTLAPEVIIEKVPAPAPKIKPHSDMLLGEDDWRSDSAANNSVDLASTGSTRTAERYKGRVIPAHALTNKSVDGIALKFEAGIADAITKHYSDDPAFLWVDRDYRMTPQAKAILAVLDDSREVGLEPAEYKVETYEIGQNGEGTDEDIAVRRAARFELALTAAMLRYGADAKSGRINPNRISGYHDFPGYKRDYEAVMRAVSSSENPAATLSGFNPGNSRFAMLMAELSELRANMDEDDIEPIAPGTFFKPGQEHQEVPKVVALIERKATRELKQSHAQTLATYDGSQLFSEDLVALVRDFQKESGLGADGIVGKNTIAKLQTASPAAKIAKIELAMERLRWHPHDLGNRHVVINQPAYRVNYVVDDKTRLAMNVVVGKPANQTYFFHDTIEVVEVNPYWNVPRSILVNEMLGKIRANPGYLSSRNYEVVTARGVTDPYAVNWNSDVKGIYIRQRPGGGNALGELKILFPNKHAIYMHDTPAKNLFSRSTRAYSHGCVRLADPRAMAAAVLGTSKEQVGSYIAGGENRSIPVKGNIPVYVSYFTAWPNDDGKVGYYADVYGRDKALTNALKKNSEMRTDTGLAAS